MANYKSLACFITDNKEALCRKIEGLSLPSDAEKIKVLCIDFVSDLTKKGSDYMNQLSLLEQDLISPVLKVMDALYVSDIELSRKVSLACSQMNKQKENFGNEHKPSFSKEYGPVFAGAAGGTLIATILKPSSWGVILMGSVISAVIGKVLYGLYVDKSVKIGHGNMLNSSVEYNMTYGDAENVVSDLVTVGECIDKVLLIYRKHLEILQQEFQRKEESFGLDKKYIGVLECYQAILGNLSDMEKTPIVMDCIKKIEQSLEKQGFKAVDYNEDTQGLFNIKERDVESIEQFSPAIIKMSTGKNILILNGDVVVPKA